MLKSLCKKMSPSMVVALVALFLALTGTAAAITVSYALNADKVDGKHAVGAAASVSSRKGKLVATSATTGRLPANIIRNVGVDFANIMAVNQNFSGATNVATVTINAPSVGWVVVRFDGEAYVAANDSLTVAASDVSQQWLVNDGNVTLDQTGSFSHTRVYKVSAGSHSFYAVVQRYIGSGSGIGSIYGTLSVEFFATRL